MEWAKPQAEEVMGDGIVAGGGLISRSADGRWRARRMALVSLGQTPLLLASCIFVTLDGGLFAFVLAFASALGLLLSVVRCGYLFMTEIPTVKDDLEISRNSVSDVLR